jgi:hypothetical protein
MASFQWQWASAGEVSKLLGAPFGLSLSTADVDKFLADKIDKKLLYWSTQRLNTTSCEIVTNSTLISSMLYFLAIWGGSKAEVAHITSRIRTFF